MQRLSIGFIGFGEAGSTIAGGLRFGPDGPRTYRELLEALRADEGGCTTDRTWRA